MTECRGDECRGRDEYTGRETCDETPLKTQGLGPLALLTHCTQYVTQRALPCTPHPGGYRAFEAPD